MARETRKVEVSGSLLLTRSSPTISILVTVYYESEVSSTKVFDIDCSGVDQTSFNTIETRLESIEDK